MFSPEKRGGIVVLVVLSFAAVGAFCAAAVYSLF